VELHDALRHVERVMVGQRNDAGAKPDAPGALGGHGQEQLGRGDHLPAGGMMFAAPELVEAKSVEMPGQSHVALKLQSRVFANRVMRRQECAETDTVHGEFLARATGSAGKSCTTTSSVTVSSTAQLNCLPLRGSRPSPAEPGLTTSTRPTRRTS